MSKQHVVTTITYPVERSEVVNKARELAMRNGLSFSAYVMELLQEDVKKNGVAQTDPLNLSRLQECVTNSDTDIIGVGIFTPSFEYKMAVQQVLDSQKDVYKTANAIDNFQICMQKAKIRNQELREDKRVILVK